MKKKNIVKLAKQNLKEKRKKLISELSELYKKKEAGQDCSDLINDTISQISLIDSDLEKKDKKSGNITWLDSSYVPRGRGNSASKAEIIDDQEYENFRENRVKQDFGPKPLWLEPGVLVRTRDRDIPGIVISTNMDTHALVLFGALEVHVRKLALRPAEWDN